MTMLLDRTKMTPKQRFLDSMTPLLVIGLGTVAMLVFFYHTTARINANQMGNWESFKLTQSACTIVSEDYVGGKPFPNKAVLDCNGKTVNWKAGRFF